MQNVKIGELMDLFCLFLQAERHGEERLTTTLKTSGTISLVIQGEPANDMVTISNMPALGVEVQAASIR